MEAKREAFLPVTVRLRIQYPAAFPDRRQRSRRHSCGDSRAGGGVKGRRRRGSLGRAAVPKPRDERSSERLARRVGSRGRRGIRRDEAMCLVQRCSMLREETIPTRPRRCSRSLSAGHAAGIPIVDRRSAAHGGPERRPGGAASLGHPRPTGAGRGAASRRVIRGNEPVSPATPDGNRNAFGENRPRRARQGGSGSDIAEAILPFVEKKRGFVRH